MVDRTDKNDSETVYSGYVLDTSAIINLERSKQLIVFELPGDWIIVPSFVAGELNPNFHGTPEATKRWLRRGKISKFTGDEELIFRKLILYPAVDDGEAQAIAMAYCRKKTLVIDEKRNGQVWKIAERFGIRCIDSKQFLGEVKPKFSEL